MFLNVCTVNWVREIFKLQIFRLKIFRILKTLQNFISFKFCAYFIVIMRTLCSQAHACVERLRSNRNDGKNEITCCIRGYHVYGTVWNSTIGEILYCERDGDNATQVKPSCTYVHYSGNDHASKIL